MRPSTEFWREVTWAIVFLALIVILDRAGDFLIRIYLGV